MTIESILVSDDSEATTVAAVSERTKRDAERNQNAIADFKMVTFSLSGKDYAINIDYVKEIAKAGNFTYVPNVLPFVVGVYNMRGEIIPILDMRLFFNIPGTERSPDDLENLLILTVEEQNFGIIVDKIDRVVGVQKSSIRPPHPLFSDVNVKYISGVVESNKHLYILLQIETIFAKENLDANQYEHERQARQRLEQQAAARQSGAQAANVNTSVVNKTENASLEKKEDKSSAENETNYKFIVDALRSYSKFFVSPINEKWVKARFEEWKTIRSGKNIQLQNEMDASEFLKTYWSASNDGWWSKEFADAFYAMLPENSAKQIVVWNPGCGKGAETYCLACVLARKYPGSKIRIYAQDIDLLSVSNAPMLAIPADMASSWISPYITKTAIGTNTFSKEIKDSIMFEYHDCIHTNALPATDIIFARDVLSFLDNEGQKSVINDFDEKLKGNGIIFVGDNEELSNSSDFIEHTAGSITAYNKQ